MTPARTPESPRTAGSLLASQDYQRARHFAALDEAIRPTPAQSARIALMRQTARPIVRTPTALPGWSWGSLAIAVAIGLVVWGWVLSMIGRAMTEAAATALDAARVGGGW